MSGRNVQQTYLSSNDYFLIVSKEQHHLSFGGALYFFFFFYQGGGVAPDNDTGGSRVHVVLLVAFKWQPMPKPHFSKSLPRHNYTLKIEYKYLSHKNCFHKKYQHCVLCVSSQIAIRSVVFGLKQCQKLFGTCFCIFSRDCLQRLLCETSLCIQLHDWTSIHHYPSEQWCSAALVNCQHKEDIK